MTDSTLTPSQEAREAWRTGSSRPLIEERHQRAAAWALDRSPDSQTWEGLTAHYRTPDQIWQAWRVAEAFARFEQAIRRDEAEKCLESVRGERLADPQEGTDDASYELALDHAEAAIRARHAETEIGE